MYAVAPIITRMAHTRPRVHDLAHGDATHCDGEPRFSQGRYSTTRETTAKPVSSQGRYNTTRETAARPVSSRGALQYNQRDRSQTGVKPRPDRKGERRPRPRSDRQPPSR